VFYWWPEILAKTFDNERMIGRDKDYDSFAYLRPFPHILESFNCNIIKASIRITFKN
jgi:hypothetical protein